MNRIIGSFVALLSLPALSAHAANPVLKKGPDMKLGSLIKKYRGAKDQPRETEIHVYELGRSLEHLVESPEATALFKQMHEAKSAEALIDQTVAKPVMKTGFLSSFGNKQKLEAYKIAVANETKRLEHAKLKITELASELPAELGKRLISDPYHPSFSLKAFQRSFSTALKRYDQKTGASADDRWLAAVNHSITKQIKQNRGAFVTHLETAPIAQLAAEAMQLHGELLGLGSGVQEVARTDYSEKGTSTGTSEENTISKKPLLQPRTTSTSGASKGAYSLRGSSETKQISAIEFKLSRSDQWGNHSDGKDAVEGRVFLEKAIRLADVYGAMLKRDPKAAQGISHLVTPEIQMTSSSGATRSFRIDMVKSKLVEKNSFGFLLGEERGAMLRDQVDQEMTAKLGL